MIKKLQNRGPENTGYAISDFGSIASARLSIIDVEGGNQLIWNEDETIAIVANCEILERDISPDFYLFAI